MKIHFQFMAKTKEQERTRDLENSNTGHEFRVENRGKDGISSIRVTTLVTCKIIVSL